MHTARHLLLLSLALPIPVMAAGANIFCCNDERGKQVCGDILPMACVGRAYREINQVGMVVRIVEAPLSPEMKALRAQEERKKQEAEEAVREQRRMDAALAQTYGNEADIDLMRQRAEADVHKSIAAANEKIAEAKRRRKKFENEAEFYKKKQVPPEVEKGLKEEDYEIRAQEELIEAKKREFDLIKAKFDEDKRRFREMKARSRTQ
ncbi:MAG TPA: hypothetical protein PLE72_11250 [Azospira sp.]|nr:hypothetical protein [Azospira sp.]HNN08117.1 hypothetical protein [Azospira sp.]HNN46108.1 hypothetical protein [Azospira sp.]